MRGIQTFTFDFEQAEDFTEGGHEANFTEAVEKIDREAEAYMEAQRAAGRAISFTTAVVELRAGRARPV